MSIASLIIALVALAIAIWAKMKEKFDVDDYHGLKNCVRECTLNGGKEDGCHAVCLGQGPVVPYSSTA